MNTFLVIFVIVVTSMAYKSINGNDDAKQLLSSFFKMMRDIIVIVASWLESACKVVKKNV